MSVRGRHSGFISVASLHWRQILHRGSFILLLILASGLLVFGKIQPVAIEHFRTHAIDGLAPILDAFQRPIAFASNIAQRTTAYFNLRNENERLRSALEQMQQWQTAVVTLQNENRELHNLLHFKTEPAQSYISARVIADTGGAFVRSMIVTAGKLDGVREGMAVMSGDGLIGRVIEAGDWSSRILLITDLNSRIPVTIAGTGERAILTGDNSASPRLLYLPQDSIVKAGAQLFTSGHGGIFPPNLPVGVVVDDGHGVLSVTPTADLSRINYVRLVDFNLKGGTFNPLANKQADTLPKKKR